MPRFKKGVGFGLTLALLALPFLIWWKFEAIYDWWQLRDYSPPAEVVRLAGETTMTDPARRVFYVNHPKLLSQTEEFRKDCPQSEQTIVLGCYHSPQKGIAIYDVSDTRLNGVEEVTAAHEMLHAAYDRLNSDERMKVDKLLNGFYSRELKDPRIKETINLYQQSEPAELTNEMHSIFATEVSELPGELENYYKRYFKDRREVVRMAQGYEGEFSRRQTQAKDYESQLSELKSKIDSQEESLKAQLEKIESDRAELDSLRGSGNIESYNNQVAAFNASVNTYNRDVARLRRDISNYNELLAQYNTLAGELRSLYGAIDTRYKAQTAR